MWTQVGVRPEAGRTMGGCSGPDKEWGGGGTDYSRAVLRGPKRSPGNRMGLKAADRGRRGRPPPLLKVFKEKDLYQEQVRTRRRCEF